MIFHCHHTEENARPCGNYLHWIIRSCYHYYVDWSRLGSKPRPSLETLRTVTPPAPSIDSSHNQCRSVDMSDWSILYNIMKYFRKNGDRTKYFSFITKEHKLQSNTHNSLSKLTAKLRVIWALVARFEIFVRIDWYHIAESSLGSFPHQVEHSLMNS